MSLAVSALAQERVDHDVIAKIKIEAFQNSKVMQTASTLTDVHGARLTGTAELDVANAWCRDEMARWGLQNSQLDPWGTIPRGWKIGPYSAEMTSPSYVRLHVIPKAWTPGTNGTVSGTPVLVNITKKADFEAYRGKLKGKIVMNGSPTQTGPVFEAEAKRGTPEELMKDAIAIDPGYPKTYREEAEGWVEWLAESDAVTRFFSEEGIAALIDPSERRDGNLHVTTQSYTLDTPYASFPAFVMAAEQYGRIKRLIERGIAVNLQLSSQAQFVPGPIEQHNVLAEIVGTDPAKKDEIVLMGGHLDSWHAGTGATDNAASCAVVMEAARILKAIGVQPRRTIRVALWTGEEQDYFGSVGYVKKRHGDPMTGKPVANPEKLAAYYNLDNGAGKIRGIFLQGNEAVRPIFEAYLAPFAYLGATTVSAKNTSGTDHMPFNGVGLPAFQFIQDPLAYGSLTHHTSLDVFEQLIEDDLKQAAAVLATFAYHTAMRDEMLPRVPAR